MAESKSMHLDPAYVKYQNMSANRWKYFRWTPRTARVTFRYVVFFPTLVGLLAYNTDGKFQLRGKQRGDMLREY
ncbi:NADH:ubiquinone oxidoreductase 6.6kD subunit [Ascobolus immersus RN42]|uniref:NADH:ubiquinone oxidoreductase 6.6kD subunit n=1 Tax=Ascobolus immersus RN42 TaxID=1160509 RepID=A0A3N4IHU8_ASCIM|nr:NADH:ubiquinone oxidoreductase 6.6kD subunit [Ascobolus immersus RN42]